MPLPASSLITWIAGLGWNVTPETGAPLFLGPYVPKMPEKLVVVTPTGGPGFVLESAADAGTFQARVRGGADDQAGAEALAYQLDALILAAPFPVTVAGRVLIHAHRLGGPPSPLAPAPDAGSRYEYTATYVAIAGTS